MGDGSEKATVNGFKTKNTLATLQKKKSKIKRARMHKTASQAMFFIMVAQTSRSPREIAFQTFADWPFWGSLKLWGENALEINGNDT